MNRISPQDENKPAPAANMQKEFEIWQKVILGAACGLPAAELSSAPKTNPKEDSMKNETMKEIAQNFLAALRTRDWELMRKIASNDIVWTLPGNSRISGEARGIEEVIRKAQTIVSFNLTFTLKHILFGQYGAVLSLHHTARRGDLVLDEHVATVLALRDGKVSSIDSYLSDVDAVNLFFAANHSAE